MGGKRGFSVVLAVLASVAFAACSNSSSGIGMRTTGGGLSEGGTLGTGGTLAVDGSTSLGGATSTTGAPGAGGETSSGGVLGAGGVMSVGGTPSTSGGSNAGASMGTGGMLSTGGATLEGGGIATGGVTTGGGGGGSPITADSGRGGTITTGGVGGSPITAGSGVGGTVTTGGVGGSSITPTSGTGGAITTGGVLGQGTGGSGAGGTAPADAYCSPDAPMDSQAPIDFSGTITSGSTIIAPGVTITVPPAGLDRDTTISVKDSVLPAPLPSWMSAIGPVLDISVGDIAALALPLQLTYSYDPSQIADPTNLLVLHYDATRGYEVTTPVALDSTNHTITVESAGFSPYLLVVAGSPVSSAVASAVSYDSGFDPAQDEWNVENFGSPWSPGGACLGMSTYAAWYYVNKVKPSLAAGFAQPRLTQNQSWGYNCWYFQETAEVQNRPSALTALQAHLNIGQYWVWKDAIWKHINEALDGGLQYPDAGTCQALPVAIEVNRWFVKFVQNELELGRPVVLGLGPSDPATCSGFHAVVAYRADDQGFDIYDPNCPLCRCNGSDGSKYLCRDNVNDNMPPDYLKPRLNIVDGLMQPYSACSGFTFQYTYPITLLDFESLSGFGELYDTAANGLFSSPVLEITSPPQFSSLSVGSRGDALQFAGSFSRNSRRDDWYLSAYYGYLGPLQGIPSWNSGTSFSVNVPLMPGGSCPPVTVNGILFVAGETIGAQTIGPPYHGGPQGRGPHSGVVDQRICTTLGVDGNTYEYQPESGSCQPVTDYPVCVPQSMPPPNDKICCTP